MVKLSARFDCEVRETHDFVVVSTLYRPAFGQTTTILHADDKSCGFHKDGFSEDTCPTGTDIINCGSVIFGSRDGDGWLKVASKVIHA